MASKQLPLDIGRKQVGQLYAKAYVGAASAAGDLDDRMLELRSLVEDVVDRHPELEEMLAGAMLLHEDRVARIDRIFAGRTSKMMVSFLKTLSAHERLDCIRYILDEAEQLYDELQGRVEAQVRSAQPLAQQDADKIRQRLEQLLDKKVKLVNEVKPELLGGVVLQVGDKVFDGSIQLQLDRMRTTIVNQSVHKIQENREQFTEV